MLASDRSAVRRATALVFLAALFYFLLFHRYGFFLQDEGVNAYQALRVLRGEVPYRDFQTAYPPAGYYVHAALFALFGPGLPVLRVAASVACAVTAALLFRIGVQVLPMAWALVPSLVYVILEDQESRGFVVHTIAYPARYVTTLWALSVLLTLAYARGPRRTLLLGLGLVTAAIVSLKHTAGIYDAWAVGACLVLVGLRDRGEPASRVGLFAALPLAFLAAVVVALPVLFGTFTGLSAPVFVGLWVPVALVVGLLVRDAIPWGGAPAALAMRRGRLRRTGIDLAWFAAAALVPTAMWVAYFAALAGPATLLQRLVLDGRFVARSYAIAFPRPGELAGGAALVIGVALVARLLSRAGLVPRERAGTALVVAVAVVAAVSVAEGIVVVRGSLRMGDPELVLMHFGRGLDNLAFYLTPVVAYAFLPALYSARRRADPRLDALLVCWMFAVFQLLLIYPRLDVAHLFEGIVLLLVPATVLVEQTLRFFQAGRTSRWLPAAAACALALLVVVKLVPRIHAQIGWEDGPIVQRRIPVEGPRGGLYETGPQGSWIDGFNRTVDTVTRLTDPGTPIFAFPAAPALYFVADRPNPTGFDYFYQGFGEGPDELAVVTRLEALQVPLVVMLQDESYDQRDRGYFPMLKDYVRRHFRQTQAIPPFRILQRVLP